VKVQAACFSQAVWRQAESGLKCSKPDKKSVTVNVLVLKTRRLKRRQDNSKNEPCAVSGLLARRTHIGELIMALLYDVRLCCRLPFEGADEHKREIHGTV